MPANFKLRHYPPPMAEPDKPKQTREPVLAEFGADPDKLVNEVLRLRRILVQLGRLANIAHDQGAADFQIIRARASTPPTGPAPAERVARRAHLR